MPEQPPLTFSVVPAIPYFNPPPNYFWHWAEEGEVVEWILGTTITYREELHALLDGLAPDGLPPLGAVLLLLAACTHAWQESSAEVGLLQGLLHNLPPGGPPDEELLFHLSVARTFLDTIRQLPAGLRTGTAKEQLLRVLLAEDSAPRQVPAGVQARHLVSALHRPAADFAAGPPLTRPQLRADLLHFERASRRFATVHSLELRLRTGLSEVPPPPEELPTPPPAEPSADLLAELAQDERTVGLARLVPYLQAALRLPRTTRQAGEQPLGGVADLSNRGPLDRLLLSELAQDDLSLLARLANGEALYLRREEPPLPHPPPRVLLLDVTLPMWGQPRVLGLAAALALAAPPGQPAAQAFALERLADHALDLRSRAGVVDALALLDPARHCGAALLLQLLGLPAGAEALLITEAEVARQPDFLSFLKLAPPALRFLLTVSRAGELVLSERAGERRTELGRCQVDVQQLLHPGRQRRVAAHVLPPAFLRQSPAPLRFPTGQFVPEYDPQANPTAAYDAALGVVAVLPSLRVLYWPASGEGALELLPLVEPGSYAFGFSDEATATAYLLVRAIGGGRQRQTILYKFRLGSPDLWRADLSEIISVYFPGRTVRFAQGIFQLESPTATMQLHCETELVTAGPPPADAPAPPVLRPPHYYLNVSHQVLRRIPRLGFDAQGQLTVGDWRLAVSSREDLLWLPSPDGSVLAQPATLSSRTPPLTANKRVRFHHFQWPDGSEAIVDGRGLLHLRSADPALPEVTLVLSVNTATAAWASAGQVSGWNYYTASEGKGDLPVTAFHARYIQPFIDRILRGQPAASNPPG